MISVVILSHKCHINPDNIATPVAEALGDLTTLTILAVISSGIFRIVGKVNSLIFYILIMFEYVKIIMNGYRL